MNIFDTFYDPTEDTPELTHVVVHGVWHKGACYFEEAFIFSKEEINTFVSYPKNKLTKIIYGIEFTLKFPKETQCYYVSIY